MSSETVGDVTALRGALGAAKVRMRPFTTADITPTYLAWLADPDVVRFSNQRFRVHSEQSCRDYLAGFLHSFNHFLAICDRESGLMLGTMTVYRNVHHGTADIGIMVGDKRVWGQGIGADAFCAVVEALSNSGLIRKITAGTLSANMGMVRIMEKAGMRHEATRRGQELLEGSPVDVVYYSRFCHA